MQRTGLLEFTPRGSKPTRSKRFRSALGKASALSWTSSIPEPPGPPGLTMSEPMRSPCSVAGSRMMATSSVPADGSS